MRVLVTGSRQFESQEIIYSELNLAYLQWCKDLDDQDGFVVVHGNAPGADTLAAQWCHDNRDLTLPPSQESHPANWSRYGNRAGTVRNMEMIQLGADLVLAFFQPGAKNVGTRHCVTEAKRWLEHRGTIIKEIWP